MPRKNFLKDPRTYDALIGTLGLVIFVVLLIFLARIFTTPYPRPPCGIFIKQCSNGALT